MRHESLVLCPDLLHTITLHTFLENTQQTISDEHTEAVLRELDRWKDQLGGAPNYRGRRPPLIDRQDAGKTCFGYSWAGIKESIKNSTIIPKFIRRFLEFLLGIGDLTQYELASQSLQRFAQLSKNKEKILSIYDQYEQNAITLLQARAEFSRLSGGLNWHFEKNAKNVERVFIEMIEMFLTKHFEAARTSGSEALMQFFQTAAQGVCFEDKAKIVLEYIRQVDHDDGLLDVIDINTNRPLDFSLGKILEKTTSLENGFKSTQDFYQKVDESGVYQMEFPTADGRRCPTLEDVHEFVLLQQHFETMDPYEIDNLLNLEYAIFQKNNSKAREDFIQRLRRNNITRVDVKTEDTTEPEQFSIQLLKVQEFLNSKFSTSAGG